jgi:hypothetical protein
LAKQEKGPPTVWQTNLAKFTSPRAYMRTQIVVAIVISQYVGGWKKKRNKE